VPTLARPRLPSFPVLRHAVRSSATQHRCAARSTQCWARHPVRSTGRRPARPRPARLPVRSTQYEDSTRTVRGSPGCSTQYGSSPAARARLRYAVRSAAAGTTQYAGPPLAATGRLGYAVRSTRRGARLRHAARSAVRRSSSAAARRRLQYAVRSTQPSPARRARPVLRSTQYAVPGRPASAARGGPGRCVLRSAGHYAVRSTQ